LAKPFYPIAIYGLVAAAAAAAAATILNNKNHGRKLSCQYI
jgi:hypothetical protein